ncbi:MAG: ATP-binding protein [Deltaproteobacteria bacterium]|nr:ATP-binding protein [Deltaproteobacteria bacterium]
MATHLTGRYKAMEVFPFSFRETARFLSGNYGSEISFNRIKNLVGLGSENTAKNYLSHLGEAYLIPTLPKFSFKNQERLRYRKTYIIDTSFAHITGLDFTPNTGKLLENVVYLELARRTSESQFELFYYKQIYEVDFLLYRNRKVHELIQVTLSIREAKTLNREIRALINAAIALKAGKLTIITLDDSRMIESQGYNIHVLPITEWLMGETRNPELTLWRQ